MLGWLSPWNKVSPHGIRYAGLDVTTSDQVIWAESMTAGTSAQKAELRAGTWKEDQYLH